LFFELSERRYVSDDRYIAHFMINLWECFGATIFKTTKYFGFVVYIY